MPKPFVALMVINIFFASPKNEDIAHSSNEDLRNKDQFHY